VIEARGKRDGGDASSVPAATQENEALRKVHDRSARMLAGDDAI
jgi:hypothetical protein